MAGIRTAIELTDGMTAPLMHMINALNMTTSAFQNLDNVANTSVADFSAIGFQEELNKANIAAAQFQEQMDKLNNEQIRVPVEPVWSAEQSPQVFTGGGMARYEQEIASANQMLNQVTQNQQRIASMSNQTDIFPDNMITDLQTMDSRIQRLRTSIEQIDNNPINDIGAAAVNNDVETLRHQLNQAITLQNELSSAMERMDVSAANAAYNRLNDVVDSTDVHIRENMNAQNQFNNSVHQGGSMMDGLKGKIGAALAVYASMQGISKALDISDTMAQTNARLSLIVDDGGSVDELQDKIFLMAENTRASFTGTSDMVAKLGLQASKAFSSNDELLSFAEQLNKTFVNVGTSAVGIDSVMLQLTQSMASGKLQGEELNAIMDNASPIIANIQRYLQEVEGFSPQATDNIKQLASDGVLTADIVKNAMLYAADETNAKFETMPKTFAQIGTSIQNNALMAFQPVLDQLNELANSAGFDSLVEGVTGALVVVSGIIIEIFNMVAQVAGFISENWSILEPLIIGAAAAMGVYALAVNSAKIAEMAQAIWTGISTAARIIATAATWLFTSATLAQAGAQWGLNAALYACPLVWIIIAIIAIIAIIYAVVAAVNKFAGTSVSATGIICGAFMVAAAAIGNVLVALINFAIDIFVVLWNFIAAFANFFANVFTDPVGAIARLFFDLVDTVLSLLQSLASAIDTIFGSNLAGSVQGWRDSLGGWVDDTFGKGVEVMAEMNAEDMHLGRFEYGDAWDAGYSFGEGVDETISNFDPASLFDSNIPNADDYANAGSGAGSVPGNVGDIADDTGAMKDAVDISSEDLKYMRDLAEMEVVNRFTTAEIKIDMGGVTNNVNSEMDLDGVVDYLGEKVGEAIEIVAAGVHV